MATTLREMADAIRELREEVERLRNALLEVDHSVLDLAIGPNISVDDCQHLRNIISTALEADA